MKENKTFTPFRWLRNLIWYIKFQLSEWKLQEQEGQEIEQVEGMSGHRSMQRFCSTRNLKPLAQNVSVYMN